MCQVNPLGHQAKTTYYGVPGDGTCNTANGSTASVFNRFGQPEKQWDANGALSEYRYDDLGWMTAAAVAPDGIGAATVSREYRSLSGIGANQPFWLHQQQRDSSGGDNTLHTWTYYDGFGRVLQTKAEADNSESTARHVETSFDYTWRDGVWREGVPRFVNGSVAVAGASAPAYNPPNWAAAGQDETVHTYDRLGRLSVKTLPNGAQVRQFYNVIPDAQNRSHAGVAVIDEANRQTIQQTDPFGRLVVAKQYTGSYSGNPGWSDAAYAQVRYDYNVADQLVTVGLAACQELLAAGRPSGIDGHHRGWDDREPGDGAALLPLRQCTLRRWFAVDQLLVHRPAPRGQHRFVFLPESVV